VYSIPNADESSVLVTGSYWRINAPETKPGGTSTSRSEFHPVGAEERACKVANLLAVQSVFAAAGVHGIARDVNARLQKESTSFLIQLEGLSGDIGQNNAAGSVNDAIHNNTLDDYHTGSERQSGVASAANILAGEGNEMDPDLVPGLICLLGAKGFGEVMEILGRPNSLDL
jgi:hypothetical protein